VAGLRQLVTQSMGVASSFGLIDRGPDALRVRVVVAALWGLFLVALLVAAGAAVGRAWRVRLPPGVRPQGGLLASWGAELYLLALGTGAALIGARSAGLTTYYGIVPAWAFSILVLLLVRRVARGAAHPHRVAGLLTGLLVLAWGAAYVGLFVARDGAVWQLRDDSARLRATAALVRTLLAGRDVQAVAWRPEGTPSTAFYLLRDPGRAQAADGAWRVGPELWTWLIGDATEVPVTSLDAEPGGDGVAGDGWGGDVARGPGEVLLVTDPAYGLVRLSIGDEVLYPPPAP
jgi:hypothetical protein